MLNKRDTLRQEAASYFLNVLSLSFSSSRPRIIVRTVKMEHRIVRLFGESMKMVSSLPSSSIFRDVPSSPFSRRFPRKTNTEGNRHKYRQWHIGVGTGTARNERRRSRLRHRNPGDETPWPSFVLRVPLLQGWANSLSPWCNPPSADGKLQGRGLPARSRLIGGRGLSTNPRPVLCFSHHPSLYRRYPNPSKTSTLSRTDFFSWLRSGKNLQTRGIAR